MTDPQPLIIPPAVWIGVVSLILIQMLAFAGFQVRQYIKASGTASKEDLAAVNASIIKLESMVSEVMAWREDRTQSIVDYHQRNEETTRRMAILDERHGTMMAAISKLDTKIETSVTRLETKFDQLLDRLPKGRGA